MIKTEHATFINNDDIRIAADAAADRIIDYFFTGYHIIEKPSNKAGVNIYGVPRGGVPAAYAIANSFNIRAPVNKFATVVDTPDDADVVVDDLVDSGRTREHMIALYPDKPFFALFNAKYFDNWLVFPWEQAETHETSAEDIPVRLLQYIGEDPSRGGLIETPARFLKAWKTWAAGYAQDPKEILKVFEDGGENYDEMVLVRDIPVYSHCEHHLAPFFGIAHVAYIPNGRIVGLSKLSRLVDVFSKRLQVQERLTAQIAETLQEVLQPKGVAVSLECRHLCMESRGIQRQGAKTITQKLTGVFLDRAETRAEFMSAIK